MTIKTKIKLDDDKWKLILSETVVEAHDIYCDSGVIVQVYSSDKELPDFNLVDKDDIKSVGGVIQCTKVPGSTFVYARSTSSSGAEIFTLPAGEKDPEQSTNTVYKALEDLAKVVKDHKESGNKDHQITKDDIGLDKIPNAISTDKEVDDEKILATTKLTFDIWSLVKSHFDNKENPHDVTKDQVGLGKVHNYSTPVGPSEYLDVKRDDLYTTVKVVHDIMHNRELSICNLKPNLVVDCPIKPLAPSEAGLADPECDMFEVGGDKFKIKAGLRVTYGRDGKSYLSNTTEAELSIDKTDISSTVTPKPGFHYIYVNLNDAGIIMSMGSTRYRPIFGIYNNTNHSDWFNTAIGTMQTSDGEIINRVYVGKVLVDTSGNIDKLLPVPIGDKHTIRATHAINPNRDYTFNNPYMEEVEVTPYILISGKWGDPKWNDQAGVRAIYDEKNPDQVSVQTGIMGLAMIAGSAGNIFSNISQTYTSPCDLRLKIKRSY